LPSWSVIARRIRVPLGFGFAAIYLWLAQPTWKSIIAGAVVCIPGLLLRGFASGHVRKNTELTTSGPYAYSRNPLYLGSLMLAAGFAIAGRNWWIAAGMMVIFVAVYLPVIRAEERFLQQQFPQFEEYARRVPRFVPRLRAPRSPTGTMNSNFSADLYWRHREYNSVLGTVGMMAALAAKMIWFVHQ